MENKIICEESNIRLDKYLALNTSFSRELITKMIKNGHILVNGNINKPSYLVNSGDIILIDNSFFEESNIEGEEMPLQILYEDDDIMVINKPSGLVVHPGNGNSRHTLVNGLKYYTDNLSDVGGAERVGIVHRLDKDTSGVMLVAKNNKAHEILANDFKDKKIYKEYVALLEGVFPSEKALVDAPIKRSKDNFNKMEVASLGKRAITHLKVLKRYKDYTLVSLVLETGRTHQIRAHMEYIGYPIYNDPVYNKKKATSFGQFLHSKTIRFKHPVTNKEMEFSSLLPKEFQEKLDSLD